jgi:hypothetical protein
MTTTTEIYAIDENKWYKGPKLNFPRGNCAATNFDDRFIYLINGKLDNNVLVIEKLDTGIDGSSVLMRALDEDLSMNMNYKWQTININASREYIENIHFNACV